MKKASKTNKGSRVIEAPEQSGDHYHRPFLPPYIDFPVIKDRSGVGKRPSNTKKERVLGIPDPDISPEPDMDGRVSPFGITAGIGLLKSDDFTEMVSLDFSVGGTGTNSRTELYMDAAWAGVERTSELDDAIGNGVFILSLGMNYKHKISEKP